MTREGDPSPDQAALEQLLRLGHPCIFVPTTEEAYATEVIAAVVSTTVFPLQVWSAPGGLRCGTTGGDAVGDTAHPAAALYHVARVETAMAVTVMYDLVAHLDDPATLRTLREAIAACATRGSTLILVDHLDRLPPAIEAEATRWEPSLPGTDELERIVRQTIKEEHRESAIEIALHKRDLETIVRNLGGLTRRHAVRILADVIREDRRIDLDDVNSILARKRQRVAADGVLEYVEAPVSLDDVGGLRRLKAWLLERRGAHSAEAVEFGIHPPRGILLLGVQGAGKSMSAKAIATAFGYPLLRLDPGTLYDRFVGESERRLRSSLHQAEAMAPIVLWIDEIEKGFASAASQSTDGGLSQRMFGTLLSWMQEHRAPVFLVATANNIDALPPELLRKGRFDEIFFVDLPSSDVRRLIFEIHLRRRGRDPAGFDLDALVGASAGFSGAEIEQSVSAALFTAFRKREPLATHHLLEALGSTNPLSVTMAERVARLRAWARERCVPAD